MKRIIRLSGREGHLEWENNGAQLSYSLRWDGTPPLAGTADCAEVEPGVYSLLMEGRSYEVKITPSASSWAVDVDGRHFVIEAVDPRSARATHAAGAGSGPLRLASPMPGKVVRILTAPGEEVQAGQGLLVVEAMKMQNEVKAPRAGRVQSVHTQEGATVAAGEVLAILE